MEARNIAFYKFVRLSDPPKLSSIIKAWGEDLTLKGTILLAHEGVNGMIAGASLSVLEFQNRLKRIDEFNDVTFRVSFSDFVPFKKLLVKVKREILTLGSQDIDPISTPAPRVSADEFHDILARGESPTLIDVRNSFEVEFGRFKGAINPKTRSFKEFFKFAENLNLEKDAPIITYCTGGIRCEKGSVVLKEAGFTNVRQLDGGILEYFNRKPGSPFFEGRCFVFDERETLDSRLKVVK